MSVMRPHILRSVGPIGLALLLTTICVFGDDRVDFDRDIRRILSDNCFQCHGPDAENREAELRLDLRDSVFTHQEGEPPRIVALRPDESELYRRVTSPDPDLVMPPPDSGLSLTGSQIALIRQWIEQGAEWKDHWSFVIPERPEEPQVADVDRVRNPVDSFVLAGLEREGLQPSSEASRSTLIRRVSLDLTGLPPTPEEVDAFVTDDSSDAWEKVIDRLLDSSAYGENMAVRWLDLARYADTSGYQNDGARDMWRWRDWVINAYNNNMPFDQFTIEQLAGDLLQDVPEPGRIGHGSLTLDEESLNRWIASAFNRNHRGNSEGGVDPDEYQVEYVVDRVDTTATVWLGLSLGCARCHDHKYDPISQTDFYRLFACFNNIPEFGRALKKGNSPPYIKAPTSAQRSRLDLLDQQIAELQQQWSRSLATRRDAQTEWENSLSSDNATWWGVSDGLTLHLQLDGDLKNVVSETESSESAPTAASDTHANQKLTFIDGRIGDALRLNGEESIAVGDFGVFGYMGTVTLAAWVRAESDGTILSRKSPGKEGGGYSIGIQNGHVYVNLINRWLDDCIRLSTVGSLPLNEWHHVAVTYDGTRQAAGISVYFDGQPQKINVHFDFLNQTIAADEPLRIGAGITNLSGAVDEVRIFDRELSPREVRIIATSQTLEQVARLPESDRTVAQRDVLESCFMQTAASESLRTLYKRLNARQQERARLVETMSTVMVMYDGHPRTTRRLNRGQFDQPAEEVTGGVPEILASGRSTDTRDRLEVAHWIVSPDHPLTARVAVNRYWQMFFGEGLVRSMEDFGVQGNRPSHPQLLDWLATEFIRNGWNVKDILKVIAMSATYRQSSLVSDALRVRDPENELLARGPRFRLSAEVVRDQALAASGLLHLEVGGPSVKSYQPEGLWSEIATDGVYEPATGDDLYRRSLYTYWKRTVAPPTMVTFDATTREMCTVRRARTNTPLQALALMNDVTYVEASRALAQRMITEGGAADGQRIARGFHLVLGRPPQEQESRILSAAAVRYTKEFENSPQAAEQLVSVGDSLAAKEIAAGELAAWTAVASVILNLDEAVMRR
ncbi:MAG: DUF1553 domain-containing protein [Fuerstiella sp.]|nr:DUF1553 domain-containing protein [Fuerstiella sp.]